MRPGILLEKSAKGAYMYYYTTGSMVWQHAN